MNPVVKAASRTASAPVLWIWVPAVVVVADMYVDFHFTAAAWMGNAYGASHAVPVALHGWMLVALAVVALASSALRARGVARGGSQAGLGIAALALGARETSECVLAMAGFDNRISVYDWAPPIAGIHWFARNVTLAAYAYGLGLVVFASVADALRRRRTPQWIVSAE